MSMVHSRPAYRCRKRAGAQQADGPDHLVVAAAPVRVPAMPVVGGPVTVEGDADFDVMLSEKLAELLAQQDAVGVDPQVQVAQATSAPHGAR